MTGPDARRQCDPIPFRPIGDCSGPSRFRRVEAVTLRRFVPEFQPSASRRSALLVSDPEPPSGTSSESNPACAGRGIGRAAACRGMSYYQQTAVLRRRSRPLPGRLPPVAGRQRPGPAAGLRTAARPAAAGARAPRSGYWRCASRVAGDLVQPPCAVERDAVLQDLKRGGASSVMDRCAAGSKSGRARSLP